MLDVDAQWKGKIMRIRFLVSIVFLGLVAACGSNSLFKGSVGHSSDSTSASQAGLFGIWIVQQKDSDKDFERYEIADGAISHVLVCGKTIQGEEILSVAYSAASITSDKIEVLDDADGETNYKAPSTTASCSSPLSKGTLNYVLNGDTLTFSAPAGTITMHRKK